jgi:hypothetical protein
MTKQTVFSIIKTLLSVAGAFLLGKNIFGGTFDENVLESISGGVMAIVSVVWSIVDKTAGIEQVQATIRQVFTLIGGVLIAWGKVSAENLELILGAILPIASLLYSYLSKRKSGNIAEGMLPIANLKKNEPVTQVVKDIKPPAEPIEPKRNKGE